MEPIQLVGTEDTRDRETSSDVRSRTCADHKRLREVQELLALRSDMADIRAALQKAGHIPEVADFLRRGKESQAIYALIRALGPRQEAPSPAAQSVPATPATPSLTFYAVFGTDHVYSGKFVRIMAADLQTAANVFLGSYGMLPRVFFLPEAGGALPAELQGLESFGTLYDASWAPPRAYLEDARVNGYHG